MVRRLPQNSTSELNLLVVLTVDALSVKSSVLLSIYALPISPENIAVQDFQ